MFKSDQLRQRFKRCSPGHLATEHSSLIQNSFIKITLTVVVFYPSKAVANISTGTL
ncbi:hypothetical protein N9H16_01825 [Candidatus Pelagibacter ubique]|nr:hypothetical protein [Candidatus Pelagibacter ubique]